MNHVEDASVWRYMDFTKYVDLISTQELFFCRSDKLGDPFEGSYSEKHFQRRLEEIRAQAKDFAREVPLYLFVGMGYRKYVYVSCWHTSEHESAALWRQYLKSDEGIAIQTTRSRLALATVGSSYPVWSVPVQYIDYDEDDPPIPTRMAAFRYKRKSFEHEKELRNIIYAEFEDGSGNRLQPPSESGIRLKVDLSQLIEVVYVAPTAPDWLWDLTARVSKTYGLVAPVIRSSLSGDASRFI